ncbi:MAG: hypothetical protein ACT4PX_06330 [Actinomycetota bacterium]
MRSFDEPLARPEELLRGPEGLAGVQVLAEPRPPPPGPTPVQLRPGPA